MCFQSYFNLCTFVNIGSLSTKLDKVSINFLIAGSKHFLLLATHNRSTFHDSPLDKHLSRFLSPALSHCLLIDTAKSDAFEASISIAISDAYW